MIYNELQPPTDSAVIVNPLDQTQQEKIDNDQRYQDLLVPVTRDGKKVYDSPSLTKIRSLTQQQLQLFKSRILRLDNPHFYLCGLEHQLYELKTKLIAEARNLPIK